MAASSSFMTFDTYCLGVVEGIIPSKPSLSVAMSTEACSALDKRYMRARLPTNQGDPDGDNLRSQFWRLLSHHPESELTFFQRGNHASLRDGKRETEKAEVGKIHFVR